MRNIQFWFCILLSLCLISVLLNCFSLVTELIEYCPISGRDALGAAKATLSYLESGRGRRYICLSSEVNDSVLLKVSVLIMVPR